MLTARTLALSDCQSVQAAVRSCVVRLEKMPVAVSCVVAPAVVSAEKSAEKRIVWSVGAADTDCAVVGMVGDDDPHPADVSQNVTSAANSLRLAITAKNRQ